MKPWLVLPLTVSAVAFSAVAAALHGAAAIDERDRPEVVAHGISAAAMDASDTRIEFEQIAQLGGAVLAARVVDGIAYVGVGPRLVVVDMTRPDNPVELGRTEPLRGLVTGVDVAGHYAYVTHGVGGLSIVDIRDAAAPRFVSRVRFPDQAVAVQVVGNRAYVAAYTAGLRVVSIDDPASPRELGSVRTGVAAVAVYVSGDYAYVAAWTDGLRIISLVDEEHPREVGSLDTPQYCKGVQVVGDTAYLADGYGGLRIVSVVNKHSPVELGAYEQTTNEPRPRFYAGGVAVAGEVAYVGGEGRIWVLRVAEPSQPSLVGFTEDAGGLIIPFQRPNDVLYMIDFGLAAYSLADRTQPRLLGSYDSAMVPGSTLSSRGLVLTERNRPPFERRRLSVVSMANPSAPVVTGHIETTAETFSYDLAGDLVYLPEGPDGLRIVSVSDPSQPIDVGHVAAETEAVAVRVNGQYAYLVESGAFTHTLRVIAIADPGQPMAIAKTELSTHPFTLLVSREHAYVGGLGLSTVWVGDPYRPSEVYVDEQELDVLESYDMQIGGDTLYVWDRGGGRVALMDLRNPARPSLIAHWDVASSSGRPVVISQGLGLLLEWYGLSAFDFSLAPEQDLIGSFQPFAEPYDAGIDGDLVYVAAGAEGLLVLRWTRLPALPKPASTAYLPSVGLSGR